MLATRVPCGGGDGAGNCEAALRLRRSRRHPADTDESEHRNQAAASALSQVCRNAGLVVLLAQPNSALRVSYGSWRAKRDLRGILEQSWAQLQSVGATLDSDVSSSHLVEFSDYECHFCRANLMVVDSALAAGIRIRLVHTPFPSSASGRGAALAALCAERLGTFPAFHRRLMTTTKWQADTSWIREASMAGVRDTARFEACLHDPYTSARLEQHLRLARQAKVSGTPTFVSKTGVHAGPATMSQLKKLSMITGGTSNAGVVK